jgi:alkylation response protein AidB-like acyl-CoA dehydrogenase
MDVELNEEQSMLQAATRRFLEHETSLDRVRNRSGITPAFEPGYWIRAAALGWTSMLVSDDLVFTDVSMPVLDLAIVAEEAGRALQPGPLVECNVVATAIARHGAPEMRTTLLPGLLDGSTTASWAYAEGSDGWDALRITMTATRDGDSFLLNGSKTAVLSGATADFFLVTADVEGELGQFIVDRDTAGLEIATLPSLDLSRDFSELTFRDVHLPVTARVGVGANAEVAVEEQWLLAVTLQSAEMVGMLERVFAWTLEYMQERYAFGRPIGSFQALKHRMADHKTWLEAALGLSTGLNRALAADSPEAMALACVTKAHIGDRAVEIVSDCAQIFGGISMTWEHDLHLYLRRATVDRVVYGSPAKLREQLCSIVGV